MHLVNRGVWFGQQAVINGFDSIEIFASLSLDLKFYEFLRAFWLRFP
jgi:hypothetical protein